jgi:hypothetical protein
MRDLRAVRPIRKGKCRFLNGSTVEVLTQSATSVRGTHVQKLRCDEVELFHEDVFAAAKFTTQSTSEIVAGMELISTMHRPYGLMQREVAAAPRRACHRNGTGDNREMHGPPLLARPVGRLPGPSEEAYGYLKIDDCLTQMRRSSRAGCGRRCCASVLAG